MVPESSSTRRRWRARMFLLAAWLSAAASTTGCYRMLADPPRDAESKRALRVLKRHLSADLPFARFYIKQLPVSVPGWRLFASEDPDELDGWPRYWVVRDGDVVETDLPLVELAHAYRSAEAVGPSPSASAEELAWLAVGLLERGTALLDQDDYERYSPLYEGDALAPPQLVRHEDGATLSFWAVTVGRGMSWTRYELDIAADYELRVTVTRPQLQRLPE